MAKFKKTNEEFLLIKILGDGKFMHLNYVWKEIEATAMKSGLLAFELSLEIRTKM